MKIITYAEIKSWGPCYDPIKWMPEGWSGTALDILNSGTQCPIKDIVYVIMRAQALPPYEMGVFAKWICTRGKEIINAPGFSGIDDKVQLQKLKHGVGGVEDYLAAFSDRSEIVETLKKLIGG
jgi:hypothetical protein